jgi:hypothetical protein
MMKHNAKQLISAALVLAIPGPALAASAKPCLTSAEARSVIQAALPDVITAVADKCRQALPSGAFLTKSSTAMSTRYRVSSGASWPMARAAFLKLAGSSGDMLKSLPDEAAKGLITAGITAAMEDKIKPDQCPNIDRAMAALAPLPPENLADLTLALLDLSIAKGETAKSPLSICPAPLPIAGTAIVNKPTASSQ